MEKISSYKSYTLQFGVQVLATWLTIFAAPPAMSQNETCPQGPSQHLNENFPAKTLVLATDQYPTSEIEKIITTLFKNNDMDRLPKIILFGSPRNLFDQLSSESQQKWNAKVSTISDQITWAQDFFEGFINKDGKPFIRLVKGYKKGEDHYQNYMKAQKDLSIALDQDGIGTDTLEPINKKSNLYAKNGHKGGNIESTNEGFCLIGNSDLSESEWNDLANQNCGGAENTIKLPTEWLPANHVDELVKQLPRGEGARCQANFAISSPKKAIEILRSNPEELFFKPNLGSDSTYMYDMSALSSLCATILRNRGVSEQQLQSYVVPSQPNFSPISPKAGTTIFRMPFANEKNEDLYKMCFELKNEDVLNLLSTAPQYTESLKISQGKIELAKKIVVEFYKNKRPDCLVHFVEMPTLFLVDKAIYKQERKSILSITSSAILPNPLNNLKINQDIFVPNSGNKSINQYVQATLSRFSLRTTFLDTFRLHVGGGNIHCSSQTIHSCSP